MQDFEFFFGSGAKKILRFWWPAWCKSKTRRSVSSPTRTAAIVSAFWIVFYAIVKSSSACSWTTSHPIAQSSSPSMWINFCLFLLLLKKTSLLTARLMLLVKATLTPCLHLLRVDESCLWLRLFHSHQKPLLLSCICLWHSLCMLSEFVKMELFAFKENDVTKHLHQWL